jgi:hypothetical protein
MSDFIDGKAFRKLRYGLKASHAAIANGTAEYFHVYGGAVAVTLLLGRVTVEAVGATTLTITHVPTAGATIPVAAAGDLDTGTIGSYITCPLTGSGVVVVNDAATGLAQDASFILPVGALTFTFGAVSGSASWEIWYIPIDDGAYIRGV